MTTDFDAAVIFPARVKEEPRDEDYDVDEIASGGSCSSKQHQKPGKRPKPTWSLKELSDDEGGRNGESEDSSEYEPSSHSDSDSEREKSSSSSFKRMKFSISSQQDVSFSSTWFQNVPSTSRNYKNPEPSSNSIVRFRKFHRSGKKTSRPPLANTVTHQALSENTCDLSNDRSIAASKYGNLIYWIRQLQEINRASQTDSENMYRCKPIFDCIFRHLKKYNFLKTARVSAQFHLLANIVDRRNSQGNTVANQVHFSLISKQLIELLHSSLNYIRKVENIQNPIVPNRTEEGGKSKLARFLKLENSTYSNSSQLQAQCNSTTDGVPLLDSSLMQTHSLKSTIPKPLSTSTTETPVYTIDDDDELTPVIENVTTLSENSSNHNNYNSCALIASFEKTIEAIMKGEIPPPVCKERENKVSWMGYSISEEESVDFDIACYRYSAFPPQFPRCKYPPNVIVTCEMVISPSALFESEKKTSRQVKIAESETSHKELQENQFLHEQLHKLGQSLPQLNSSRALVSNKATSSNHAFRLDPLNRKSPQRIPSPDIIVISDSDDDDSIAGTALVNLPSCCPDKEIVLCNDISGMKTNANLDSGVATITDDELVLGL